jgi:hypothetical protein
MKLLLLLAAALLAAPAPADQTVPSWLAGRWVAESDGRWTEETWSAPRGRVMLGTSLSGKGEAATTFEFMRIAPDAEGRLTFWGSPEGKPAVPFVMERGDGEHVLFVNRGHGYPQRILYGRRGDRLVAAISMADGSMYQSWRYKRVSSK